MSHPWKTAAFALLFLPTVVAATDLDKIDRTIGKEPTYRSKQPLYCLLVFGPKATLRVWLVADGDDLYVDRNGNGDLTEVGERVTFAKYRASDLDAFEDWREADAGHIIEGKMKHEDLRITQERVRPNLTPKERSEEVLKQTVAASGNRTVFSLRITLENRPRPGDPIRVAGRIIQSAGMDGEGFLQFASDHKKAPIVHLRGPLQMGLYNPQRLNIGSDENELVTLVGTPGLGKGAFASISYYGLIGAGVAPAVEFDFPAIDPGKPLSRSRHMLEDRC